MAALPTPAVASNGQRSSLREAAGGKGGRVIRQSMSDKARAKMSSKDDMVDMVAQTTGCTKTSARDAVNKLFGSIMAQCKRAGEVKIPGFGKFKVRKRAARMGRNPQTGQSMRFKASKSIGFRPAAAFKGSL